MNTLEQIKLLVETKPKHYAKMIANNPVLLDAVSICAGDTLPEKIYSLLNPTVATVCELGNKKKFTSIYDGYRFCGVASKCACAKASVSAAVAKSKAEMTAEERAAVNERRAKTNLEKYGVENIGQTEKAKAAHAEFYADPEKVEKANLKGRQTRKQIYGDENYRNVEQIKKTWEHKQQYWVDRFPDKKIEDLSSKDRMQELYSKYSIQEITEICNVSTTTVHRWLATHDIKEPYKSSVEQEILIFLQQIGVNNIVRNTRRLIATHKEIDFYLPDYKLAIEYNGNFWHHDRIPHITKEYHASKFYACAEKDIQLITIFSDAWDMRKAAIKTLIKSKIDQQHGRRIYANHCSVDTIPVEYGISFIKEHSVEAPEEDADICYQIANGLEPVGVMTFKRKSCGTYELLQYATSTKVVGGTKVLLNQFLTDYNYPSVVSYSRNEFSKGDLQQSLGFQFSSDIKPKCWYATDRNLTMRKIDYFKDLDDTSKLLRIWDCGSKLWTR